MSKPAAFPSPQETSVQSSGQDVPILPAEVVTTLGERVELRGPIWRMRGNRAGMGEITISVGLLDSPRQRGMEQNIHAPSRSSTFHPDMIHLIKVFLAESMGKISPRGAGNRSRAFNHFERYLFDRRDDGVKGQSFTHRQLTYEVLAAYTDHCNLHTAAKGANPGVIRRFYNWGLKRNLAGFAPAKYQELQNINMGGSLQGHIARFRHPRTGAFTWEEQVQINRKIKEGEGDDEARAIVSLYQQLGIRPEALVLLQRQHLEILPMPSGAHFFLLVPRVKKPGAVVASNDYVRRPIDSRLGDLLMRLQRDSPGDSSLPLLPSLTDCKRPHSDINHKIKQWADEVNLVTTRLTLEQQGWRDTRLKRNHKQVLARLPITAYRFRRTLATNLAEQGASVYEIAAALDDETIEVAANYVENTSAITDVLDMTLDRHPEWIEVITLFRGELSNDPCSGLPEILGGVPHLADYQEFKDIGVIGHCASTSPCKLEPPLSCYLCPSFRPSHQTHPHELQLLQIRRDVHRNAGVESERMGSVLRQTAGAVIELLARLAPSKGAMTAVLNRIKETRTRPARITP
jgi:integrase